MPTHTLFITSPKMVCGGCTGTVEAALKGCKGVTAVDVSLSTQTATVTTSDDSIACTCAKGPDGKCKCGDDCTCMQKSLIAACDEAGFKVSTDSVAAAAAKSCSCCCCGATCACGPNCTCSKKSTRIIQQVSMGVAIFAIGWMASKKFAK